jgi:hypothetical protein
MKLKRYSNWPTRLHLLIQNSKDVPFDWGRRNCGLFVTQWIREATGVDLGAPFLGKATDEASAEAIFLNGFSGPTALGDFAASIAAANSIAEVLPVTYAQRGDVVWVDNSTALNPSAYGALGVVSTDGKNAVCMSEKGTVRVHMQHWKRAWRI